LAHGVNKSNLIKVNVRDGNGFGTVSKLSCGYLNARSVKNKASEISEFITDNKLDVCAISETWLNDGDVDAVSCDALKPAGYRLDHVPRSTGKGGGVAVVYKSTIKSLTAESGQTCFF
jgi:tRNA A58 N-methylase Trm61